LHTSVRQRGPEKPVAQVHAYSFTRFMHVPPFAQGLGAHSSMSMQPSLPRPLPV
jgi:hypothetical protein